MHHHRLARATQRALCPRRTRPVRSCGKHRFVDRIAADLALVRSHGQALGREPVRSCGCTECDGWHLTSIRWWREPTSTARAARRH